MPTAKQIRGTYSNKLEHRKNRKTNQKVLRETKIVKVRKNLGLPEFGDAKKKLEKRTQLMKERLNKGKEEKVNCEGSCNSNQTMSLESMVQNAQGLQKKFEEEMENQKSTEHAKEENAALQTRRAFFYQLKEVISRSDVIIIVLDARDPMGCRSKLVERKILEKDPNKRIILLINKIDLVPKNVALMWLSILRREYPTILFKASTQSQKGHLGRNDMDIKKASNTVMSSNVCLGAENVLQLLKNYCRSNGVKTAITVGIIGYPNVGKSSFINSLKRSRAAGVSSTAGFTRAIQEIQIDRHISLLDSPGIIFNSNSSSFLLRNCVDVHELDDPVGIVERMMMSLNNNNTYLQHFYAIPPFSTIQDLLAYVAGVRGKLKKGGIPDLRAAACVVINDFNQGMIPFYTKPSKRLLDQTSEGLQIVEGWSNSFDFNQVSNDNIQVMKGVDSEFTDEKYMVLDAADEVEDPNLEDEMEIPILDRHIGKRESVVQSRIPSKEEILLQRQEMLQEEMMKENMEMDQYENAEDNMELDEDCNYSASFFQ